MEAILASPSAFSPPSSPPDSSSPGSPLLPALSSPFSLGSLASSSPEAATPSRNGSLKTKKVVVEKEEPVQPSWMTDELDEEWVEDDEPDQQDNQGSDGGDASADRSQLSFRSNGTKKSLYGTHRSSPLSSLKSHHPRIPSSLRFALQPSSSPSQHRNTLNPPRSPTRPATSPREGAENVSPESASSGAGTFVARSSADGGSYRARGGEGPSQLAAAVRALKGPRGGLGAREMDEEERRERERADKSPIKGRKGLSSLFEPPSPPGTLQTPPAAAGARAPLTRDRKADL